MPDGPLDLPHFTELPPVVFPQSRRRFKYADLLDKVRDHPNVVALIAVFETGHPDVTAQKCRSAASQITLWLAEHYPLEAWEVHQRRDSTTWSKRELYVCYRGMMTQEQAAALREARRAKWATGKANGERKRAARDAANRILNQADAKAPRRNAF